MGYTKHAIKGISWMSGLRVVTRGVAFLKILVLARVLSPTQFGVFGIATLALSFLETITETGINIVLIQSDVEIGTYINSAWVVSLIRGTVIMFCILASAPFVSLFFHSSEAIGILLFTSLVPFVRGFINPAEARFQKELKFHYQFWFNSFLFLIDAITSITIALLTHSVYSLIWGMLVGALCEVVLSFVLITPRPKFMLDKGYFREIFHRGSWVTAYTIFNYIAENLDNAFVGHLLGATQLGFYQMAYKIAILPITEISEVVSSVVFPVYAKISTEIQRLKVAFFKTALGVVLGSLCLGIVIFFFPREIIIILLGSRWLIIVPVLQVLIIYGVLRTIGGPASALLLSLNKQRYVSLAVFSRLIILAIAIYPMIQLFGLIGAGIAQVLAASVELPIYLFLAYKAIAEK